MTCSKELRAVNPRLPRNNPWLVLHLEVRGPIDTERDAGNNRSTNWVVPLRWKALSALGPRVSFRAIVRRPPPTPARAHLARLNETFYATRRDVGTPPPGSPAQPGPPASWERALPCPPPQRPFADGVLLRGSVVRGRRPASGFCFRRCEAGRSNHQWRDPPPSTPFRGRRKPPLQRCLPPSLAPPHHPAARYYLRNWCFEASHDGTPRSWVLLWQHVNGRRSLS